MKRILKNELHEFRLLIKSVPSVTVMLFVIAVFTMNLLANKLIDQPFEWLAVDCGIIVSWLAFLVMDIITKHFGPKGATQISVLAIVLNLFICFIFYTGSRISGMWSASYSSVNAAEINSALDLTFGGTWYVLFGSTVAFFASSVINNFTNHTVGKLFKKRPDGVSAFISRAYVSTAISQFCDNFIFAFLVSHTFFGLSMLQCFTCALTGMIAELICEIVFSPVGFAVCKRWKSNGVGEEYIKYMEEKHLR